MDDLLSKFRMDRRLTGVRSLDQEGDDREFWHSQTPEQRLLCASRMIGGRIDPANRVGLRTVMAAMSGGR